MENDDLYSALKSRPRRWLVTGAAGFIGSNLVEALLRLEQEVVGLDNFATGSRRNLAEIEAVLPASQWARFRLIEGDVARVADCEQAVQGIQIILHQAALGSVPRSLRYPLATHEANVTGFVNMIEAARQARVGRFVYASSSSVYGDHPRLPKVEDEVGQVLSPYALSKKINEQYAEIYARCFGLPCVGLRYFNVFGARQDPESAYAAVLPIWITALIQRRVVEIFGDGETSRDFCYVENVVQANLRAATTENPEALGQVYNVAAGGRVSLNQAFARMRDLLAPAYPWVRDANPVYRDFRAGDVRHSQADISRARARLGYQPEYDFARGLERALDWYRAR